MLQMWFLYVLKITICVRIWTYTRVRLIFHTLIPFATIAWAVSTRYLPHVFVLPRFLLCYTKCFADQNNFRVHTAMKVSSGDLLKFIVITGTSNHTFIFIKSTERNVRYKYHKILCMDIYLFPLCRDKAYCFILFSPVLFNRGLKLRVFIYV